MNHLSLQDAVSTLETFTNRALCHHSNDDPVISSQEWDDRIIPAIKVVNALFNSSGSVTQSFPHLDLGDSSRVTQSSGQDKETTDELSHLFTRAQSALSMLQSRYPGFGGRNIVSVTPTETAALDGALETLYIEDSGVKNRKEKVQQIIDNFFRSEACHAEMFKASTKWQKLALETIYKDCEAASIQMSKAYSLVLHSLLMDAKGSVLAAQYFDQMAVLPTDQQRLELRNLGLFNQMWAPVLEHLQSQLKWKGEQFALSEAKKSFDKGLQEFSSILSSDAAPEELKAYRMAYFMHRGETELPLWTSFLSKILSISLDTLGNGGLALKFRLILKFGEINTKQQAEKFAKIDWEQFDAVQNEAVTLVMKTLLTKCCELDKQGIALTNARISRLFVEESEPHDSKLETLIQALKIDSAFVESSWNEFATALKDEGLAFNRETGKLTADPSMPEAVDLVAQIEATCMA